MTDSKNCGSCKWLAVTPEKLTKALRTHKRYDLTMFRCTVPFNLPAVPKRVRVEISDALYMCPSYGAGCAFHAPREAVRTSPPDNAKA